MFRIVPKPDLVVIGLDGRPLPTEGAIVPELTRFWRRREADGDVTISEVADEIVVTAKKKG